MAKLPFRSLGTRLLPSRLPAQLGVIIGLGLIVTGVAAGCGGGSSDATKTAQVTRPADVATVTATATSLPATATATEPPPATPTATPPPTATATAASAATAGPVNVSASTGPAPSASAGFPPPPPRSSAPPFGGSGMVRISAPRLSLDNYIEVVHVVNNEMQTPVDASYSVGWYPEFLAPGNPGNSIFSAHETWNHFQGPFYGVHNAQAGDDVYVEMTNGQRFHYRVFSNTRYPVASMPMAEIIWPSNRPANEEWLTLLTCGGRIVYDHTGFGEYLDRDVVVAKRIP